MPAFAQQHAALRITGKARMPKPGWQSVEEAARRLKVTPGSIRHACAQLYRQGLAMREKRGRLKKCWYLSPDLKVPLPPRKPLKRPQAKPNARIVIQVRGSNINIDVNPQ